MTPAERPTSITEQKWLEQSDIDRLERCGLAVRSQGELVVTQRGWRELCAVAWFTDLPGDERIA